jgi:hypothetical protein
MVGGLRTEEKSHTKREETTETKREETTETKREARAHQNDKHQTRNNLGKNLCYVRGRGTNMAICVPPGLSSTPTRGGRGMGR